jgi:hypothetical protein
MACTTLRNVFEAERSEGRMKLPHAVVPRDFPDIQPAVDSSPAGGVVAVLEGTYRGLHLPEHAPAGIQLIGIHGPKKVKIIGHFPGQAAWPKGHAMNLAVERQVPGTDRAFLPLFVESASGASIMGFTIIGTDSYYFDHSGDRSTGITVTDTARDIIVQDCIVMGAFDGVIVCEKGPMMHCADAATSNVIITPS